MSNIDITWKCHVCGLERPDANISVRSVPFIVEGNDLGKQNLRYCNDNDECTKQAGIFKGWNRKC